MWDDMSYKNLVFCKKKLHEAFKYIMDKASSIMEDNPHVEVDVAEEIFKKARKHKFLFQIEVS